MEIEVHESQPWIDKKKLCKTLEPIVLHNNDSFVSDLPPETNRVKKHVFLACEPECVRAVESFLLEYGHHYDGILTYIPSVLNKFSHAVRFFPGQIWIDRKDWESCEADRKRFAVSTIVGHKFGLPEYTFRQDINLNQELIRQGNPNLEFDVFRSAIELHRIPLKSSKNLILGKEHSNKIHTLREYQFQIVIENTRQVNCFSEKLNDCLITRTIPIYYGCINISDFFDTRGWIILNSLSLDELKGKLGQIDEGYYEGYLDTIEANYKEVQQYESIYENINRSMRQFPWFKIVKES